MHLYSGNFNVGTFPVNKNWKDDINSLIFHGNRKDGGSWTCLGFAKYVFAYLFNIYSLDSGCTVSYCKNFTSLSYGDFYDANTNTVKIAPGAYIESGNHTLIVLAYDKDSITLYDGNWGRVDGGTKSKISVSKYSWNEVMQRLNNYKCWFIAMPKAEYYHVCTEWNDLGSCTVCGLVYPYQDNFNSNTVGYLMTKSGDVIRNTPYDKSSGTALPTVGTGRWRLRYLGFTTNCRGEKWYCVSYEDTAKKSGMTGWIKTGTFDILSEEKNNNDGGTTPPISVNTDITFSALSAPSSFQESTSYIYNISGTVASNNYKISKLEWWFEDADNGTQQQYGGCNPNVNTINLIRSAANLALVFGRLKGGHSYKYAIRATNTAGRVVSKYSNVFSVSTAAAVPTVSAPLLSEISSTFGGKTIRITNPTEGATLYYYYDGCSANHSTTAAYADVPITHDTSFTAYAEKGGRYAFANGGRDKEATFYVPQLGEPGISSNQTAQGTYVTISGDRDAQIFCSVDGASFQRYSGTFCLTEPGSVKAYQQKKGFLTSGLSESQISVDTPSVPVISLYSAADIAAGDAMTVKWETDALASSYDVAILKDGKAYQTASGVTGTMYSFSTGEAGTYSVSVTAKNAAGASDSSNEVSCTAHAPLTVTFQDWDKTTLAVQTIRYGYDAQTGDFDVPYRRGYTFRGWVGSTTAIKADGTVTADYKINTYSVKFYDTNGTYLTTQGIVFDQPIDSTAAQSLVVLKTGYSFNGWQITKAADDSMLDLDHIDSDMSLYAVTGWANQDLPNVITGLSATRNFSTTAGTPTGYDVSFQLSNYPNADTKAKIVISLLSSDHKMLGVSIIPVNSLADVQNQNQSHFVSYDGTAIAASVEVSILAIDGNDRTGGPLAQTVSCIPTPSDSDTAAWSEWMDALPDGVTTQTESKTMYRYQDGTKNTTTTGNSTAPNGYTYESTSGYWGAEQGPVEYVVNSSSTRQVRTTSYEVTQGYTEYRYWRWTNGTNNSYCPAIGKSYYGGSWYEQWSSWSTTRFSNIGNDFYCSGTSSDHVHNYVIYTDSYGANWHPYFSGSPDDKSGRWFYEESRYVNTSYNVTQYYWKDWVPTYTYYKWDYGVWSGWSDSPIAQPADGSKQVETKTVYRYVKAMPETTTGDARTISGTVEKAVELAGKNATLMVYKSRNTDPTEAQLEYIGQTKLGADGSYEYTFKTKEEPSVSTGDFIVTLAIEGCDGLINIGLIEAPKPNYTVTFCDDTGNVISEATVEEGGTAEAPAIADKTGYIFTGWSKSTSNVTCNLTVLAQYRPVSYTIAYVDYLNQTCVLKRAVGGDALAVPETPSHDGYTFKEWKCVSGGNTTSETEEMTNQTVGQDMVVQAIWEPDTFTVEFVDSTGKVCSTQTVKYGEAAVPPTTVSVGVGMIFRGWEDSSEWWCVHSNMTVYPIVSYESTTPEPASNMGTYASGGYDVLELSSIRGATIYYTLDGTDPNPENVTANAAATLQNSGASTTKSRTSTEGTVTYKYDGSIELTKSEHIRAIAVASGKNDSDIIDVNYTYEENRSDDTYEDYAKLGTYNVKAEPGGTVTLQFLLNDSTALSGCLFSIKADPTIFGVYLDPDTGDFGLKAGELCENKGTLMMSDYSDAHGWQVIWYGTENTNGIGTLFTLKLQVSDEAIAGTYPITVSYSRPDMVTAKDLSGGEDFSPTAQQNTDTNVSVGVMTGAGTSVLGDVNGDGVITMIDVVRMARYLIDDITFTDDQLKAADVTADGKVTAADVIRLSRYLIGLTEIG